MGRLIALIAAAALVVGGFYAARQFWPSGPAERGDTGPTQGPQAPARYTVAALGRLVPEGGILDVGGTTGMRLAELMVAENQQVAAGDELAHLQDYPLREQEVAFAQQSLEEGKARLAAERSYAQATVAQAKVAAGETKLQEEEIRAQEGRLGPLRSSLRIAEKSLERVQGISERVVSAQEREQLELAVEQARDAVQSAEGKIQLLRSGQKLAEENAQAGLQAAQANLARVDATVSIESLNAQVKLAEQKLEQSIIRAPVAGKILEILLQPGEVIGQRPILQMGDISKMQAIAEVYETDIGLVKVGQSATIQSPALPNPIKGIVRQIGTMVSQNEIMSIDPAARADIRVVPVTIELADSAAAARLVNLQVDVTIDVAPSAKSAGTVASGSERASR